MLGYGRGWHRGYQSREQITISAPEGYTYIGPCRCGFGPDAFYRDKSGRIVHASQLFHWSIPPTTSTESLEAEVNQLKKENEELGKRIKELEDQLKVKER